jgi:hypothetical protein
MTSDRASCTRGCPYVCPCSKGTLNTRSQQKCRLIVSAPRGALREFEHDALARRAFQEGRDVANVRRLRGVATGVEGIVFVPLQGGPGAPGPVVRSVQRNPLRSSDKQYRCSPRSPLSHAVAVGGVHPEPSTSVRTGMSPIPNFTAPWVAPQEVDRGSGRYGNVVTGLPRSVDASCAGTPGSLINHEPIFPMSNYHLFYAISKRTPPSPKTMKAITDVQAELNRRMSWSHDRLSLAPERQAARAPLAFPFVRFAPSRPTFASGERQSEAPRVSYIEDAFACGSTKVRDNLWNAFLVVAFLKHVSMAHPELFLELRDDGGFVLPGAVRIRNGNVELNREWLNRERERTLEMTGDPQAAAPFVWAETEALEGRFFQEATASEYAEVPEIKGLELDWEQLETVRLEDAADVIVKNVASSVLPAKA